MDSAFCLAEFSAGRRRAARIQRGKKKGRKNRNHGNYHEEFYQCET